MMKPGSRCSRAFVCLAVDQRSSALLFVEHAAGDDQLLICWVPSKMSRIFASRAHFSSRMRSRVADGRGELDGLVGQPSLTVRPALAFDIDASSEFGCLLSAIHAARMVSR